MKLSIYQVDAFTNQLFSGNPAAVVLSDTELPSFTMQSVAAENNLSETAFVTGTGNTFQIRWFTPTVEVDLCGHATLAAAHVLFRHLNFKDESVAFSSRSGSLYVKEAGDILFLDFPADDISEVPAPEFLIEGLRSKPLEVYKGRDDYLVILEHQEDIISLSPDLSLVSKVPARGVIVSSPGHDADFVSRFFAPQSGVPEDPVTGSAHTTLIPYWSKRLGKRDLSAKQLSKRGGELLCRDTGERVEIGGRAITYLVGEISI
jgi:predicted PhzF superfamily epimerase YddE/YHI9